MYNIVNYFNDKQFAKQVALHQLLYRKLLKFAYDNECEDAAKWDGDTEHFYICFNKAANKFDVDRFYAEKFSDVSFYSYSSAERAIKEVVEPFMKEHPDFSW